MKHNYQGHFNVFLPVLFTFFTFLFLGLWFWYWSVVWPPTWFSIMAAGIGGTGSLIFCVDRFLHWDVRTWQWRSEQRRNQNHHPIFYQLGLYGGVLGIITTKVVDHLVGEDISAAILIPLSGAFTGFVSLWATGECVIHLIMHCWESW